MPRDSLDGIRVLDFSHVVAGPVCGMLLGDLGADVVKIEALEGELGRTLGPPWINGESVVALSVNRNKRGLAVNLKDPEARKAVLRMAANADVIIESFRPGVMEKLGLGYPEIATLNPGIVYCSVSAYGQNSSQRDKPGVDGIIQAATGLMSTLGEAGAGPTKVSIPIADMTTGYLATVTILAALQKRSRTQTGQQLDVSLYNATIMLQQVGMSFFLATDEEPQRIGSAAAYAAPNEAFPTADGWIMVAAYQPERWKKLCVELDFPELETDIRFSTNSLRVLNRAALNDYLGTAFRKRPSSEWIGVLNAIDILCAPVATYKEVTQSPQYRHGGTETYVDHPVAGRVRMPSFSVGDMGAESTPSLPPPMIGEHSELILAEYGFSPTEIDVLMSRGAVKQTIAPKVQKF